MRSFCPAIAAFRYQQTAWDLDFTAPLQLQCPEASLYWLACDSAQASKAFLWRLHRKRRRWNELDGIRALLKMIIYETLMLIAVKPADDCKLIS